MKTAYVLGPVVFAALVGVSVEARAQAPARRGPYYGRTMTTRGRSGLALERGIGAVEGTSAATPDPLGPYTSRPSGAAGRYSSEPPPPQPAPTRPQPRPIARNYYPTARIGQSANLNVGAGRRHCTPSRAGFLGR
jgi:hypothetical protein